MGIIAFFTSLICLIYFGTINSFILLQLIDASTIYLILWFIAGLLAGIWLINILVKNEISVLIHELKHSIVANLAGNKFKAFMIRRKHGHFTYTYTKDTAHYNSLIALAPYFLPLFTAPGVIMVYIALQKSLFFALFLLGLFYGADSRLNYRDIGPHQTDFTNLTGGYRIGLVFIVFMNLSILTLILSWVMLQNTGIKHLFAGHFNIMQSFLF